MVPGGNGWVGIILEPEPHANGEIARLLSFTVCEGMGISGERTVWWVFGFTASMSSKVH